MVEAGLLEGGDHTSTGSEGPEGLANRLTWAGHEFLDAARDDATWGKAKTAVKTAGGVGFEVLKTWAGASRGPWVTDDPAWTFT